MKNETARLIQEIEGCGIGKIAKNTGWCAIAIEKGWKCRLHGTDTYFMVRHRQVKHQNNRKSKIGLPHSHHHLNQSVDVVTALEFNPMTQLPQNAHPTAKAFFDALDQYNKDQAGGHQTIDNDDDNGKPPISDALKRKSQSLGWRNRNSQNEFYPVTVCQSFPSSKADTGSRSTQIRHRNFSVHQVQRGEVEGTYGTGATVWPAAMVLIKYLERNHNNDISKNSDNSGKNDLELQVTLRGRHVIDLGGGTGIGSIAAALLGASSVVCTDGEESVVRLARDNIVRASHQLSEVQEDVKSDPLSTVHDSPSDTVVSISDCPIRAQTYWWGDGTSQSLMGSNDNTGLAILVADCVLPKLYPIAPLVQAIDECLRLHDEKEGTYDDRNPSSSAFSSSFAVVSYEHRYYPDYDPRVEFRRLATESSLDVFAVPREEMDPVYSLEDVEIWIVRCHRCPPC